MQLTPSERVFFKHFVSYEQFCSDYFVYGKDVLLAFQSVYGVEIAKRVFDRKVLDMHSNEN